MVFNYPLLIKREFKRLFILCIYVVCQFPWRQRTQYPLCKAYCACLRLLFCSTMTNPTAIKETVPKAGLLFQEITLHPVLCKPKIMPLKSVTLEKLEKMQKEAQEKVMEMERKQERPSTGISRPKTGAKKIEADEDNTLQDTTRPVSGKKDRKADVWRADEDGQSADEAGQD